MDKVTYYLMLVKFLNFKQNNSSYKDKCRAAEIFLEIENILHINNPLIQCI